MISWVVMLCSDVGYQRFRGPEEAGFCSFHTGMLGSPVSNESKFNSLSFIVSAIVIQQNFKRKRCAPKYAFKWDH
jgi:hypothetical protein